MTTKELHDYTERAFDAFCRTVIRNESADALRDLAEKSEHEIEMSMLPRQDQDALSCTDEYHLFSLVFLVGNLKISVDEPAIAHALQYLTPHKRDVLLLYYFHGETDAEIGKRMKQTESAVFRRRIAALQRLKEIMEDLNDEA